MIDDRRRVAVNRPGSMQGLAGQSAQFRHVALDENTLRIEPLALPHRVEDPEIRHRIRARGRAPLPAAIVGGEIAVDQPAHEWGSPPRRSINKCLVRDIAVTMRSRLCIQPVSFNWRMAASTSGYPVCPSHQAWNCS